MWAGIDRIVFALSKEHLSHLYYGGNYTTQDINKMFLKPIEIIQIKELADKSMEVVNKWEKQCEGK